MLSVLIVEYANAKASTQKLCLLHGKQLTSTNVRKDMYSKLNLREANRLASLFLCGILLK